MDILVLFGKSLAERAAWENSRHFAGGGGGGEGRDSFWETLICSFVFSSLSWISEIVTEALKFTEHLL